MEVLSLPPLVIKKLAKKLRAIRRCPFSLSGEYEKEFRGYIDALLDLDLISWQQWLSLSDLAVRVWESASRLDARRIRVRTELLISQCLVEVVQDEPEQVSAPAAPGRVSVRGVLVPKSAFAVEKKPLLRINFLSDEDGDITLDRTAFPQLGKHWAPASVLVGYQKRKGHSVCRA